MYDNGWGVEENKAEAVKWYNKATKQGDVWAQYILGYLEYRYDWGGLLVA